MPDLASTFDVALETIIRRKWLAILSFLGTLAATQPAVSVLPNLYRSSATVLVEHQQIPEELVRSTVTSALDTRLQTISQEILSRSRLQDLINRFDLYSDLLNSGAQLEDVVARMRRDIEIEMKGSRGSGTVAFTVGFRGRDPQKIAAVTNTLASFYIEENLKVREQQAAGTSQFLRSQLEEMQEQLEEMEKRVSSFKAAHIGELPHQQEANLSTLEQVNTRLRMNGEQQIRISERLIQFETQLAEAEDRVNVDGPDATAVRIAKLQAELRELRKTYSDKYPDVIRVKSEIAFLVEQLREYESTGADEEEPVGASSPQVAQLKKTIGEAKAELKPLQAEAESLYNSIATYQRRVESAPLREQEYQVLMRDYQTTTDLYRSLLVRQREAELAENMEQRQKGEQFRIIDPALPLKQPAAPNRQRLHLMGFLLSLGLAVGAVLLVEQMDTSFHTVDDLRANSRVPFLASIPRIMTKNDKRRRRGYLRFALAAIAAVVGLVVIVAASFWFARGNEQLVGILM